MHSGTDNQNMLKWLYDTFTGIVLEQLIVAHWGLRSLEFELWMKHDGHEDLRGSGRWSVTPYINGSCVCIAKSFFITAYSPWRPMGRMLAL
jgi:hypothetical protein